MKSVGGDRFGEWWGEHPPTHTRIIIASRYSNSRQMTPRLHIETDNKGACSNLVV